MASYNDKNNTQRIARNEREKLKKREAVAGYPMERKLTLDEVDAYFTEERITCLMCGKKYKGLGSHIRVHDINEEEYKMRFGLPLTRGFSLE